MKGVSPLIALVLTIFLTVVAMAITLSVITPTLDRMKDSNVVSEARLNLGILNTAIKEVSSESEKSKRTVPLAVTDGEYSIDTSKEQLYFTYNTKGDLDIEGSVGDIEIDKSPVYLEFFNQYNEGDSPGDWTCSGTCSISSNQYSVFGMAYHNINQNVRNFLLQLEIRNDTGSPQAFVIPGDASNLKLFLTFDEGSSTTAYDYSGNANNGTLKNGTDTCTGGDCPTWVDGKYGKALQFDGVNDFVSITSLSSMESTVELWKKNSTDSVWYHLVNSSGTLYVNGISGSGQVVPISNSSGTVIVGVDGSGNYFNGIIDEVKIYNRSLTSEEIQAEYEWGLQKLNATRKTDYMSEIGNATIVLANPTGRSYFDDIKIKTQDKSLRMTIPYIKIDFNASVRISKGNYKLIVEHKGMNSTTNKPIIEISRE